MTDFRIVGRHRLAGSITAQGSKNASLPIFVASLLTDEAVELHHVPALSDIETLSLILHSLGKAVEADGNGRYLIRSECEISSRAPQDLVQRMRASFLVLGPLLARTGSADVALPGGDAIGARPVDLHLSGLEAMGAQIDLQGGVIYARANRLKPAEISLTYPSVGATEHLMLTAALVPGRTVIRNPAREPEVDDLSELLSKMGAQITRRASHIEIEGQKRLQGASHAIVPDRLCAGTYLIAAALCGGEVSVGCRPEHLRPLTAALRAAGVALAEREASITITAGNPKECRPLVLETHPYPGFPTDLQAMMAPLLALTPGTSRITETVFEDRFRYVRQLRRMGAAVELSGRTAIIKGVDSFKGAEVEALDIRAGVALVLAGLAAEGVTLVKDPRGHIARGYQNLGGDLRKLRAEITTSPIA